MRVLVVSRPVERVLIAVSGGVLAMVDCEDPHKLRLAALELARDVADPSRHQRGPLEAGFQIVALEGGGPRLALLRVAPDAPVGARVLATLGGKPLDEGRTLLAVLTLHEFELARDAKGRLPLEPVEPAEPETLQ